MSRTGLVWCLTAGSNPTWVNKDISVNCNTGVSTWRPISEFDHAVIGKLRFHGMAIAICPYPLLNEGSQNWYWHHLGIRCDIIWGSGVKSGFQREFKDESLPCPYVTVIACSAIRQVWTMLRAPLASMLTHDTDAAASYRQFVVLGSRGAWLSIQSETDFVYVLSKSCFQWNLTFTGKAGFGSLISSTVMNNETNAEAKHLFLVSQAWLSECSVTYLTLECCSKAIMENAGTVSHCIEWKCVCDTIFENTQWWCQPCCKRSSKPEAAYDRSHSHRALCMNDFNHSKHRSVVVCFCELSRRGHTQR